MHDVARVEVGHPVGDLEGDAVQILQVEPLPLGVVLLEDALFLCVRGLCVYMHVWGAVR